MDIKKKFGLRLRNIRKAKNISQEKLGFISSLHRTYISDIENGSRNVALENIEKLAKALEVEIKDFFNN